ncbi:MAG: DUF4214 domain-containing protein [Acidimicrobiia bacterium]|nr:DUF4214 domain-containing protein [Acidimicrobiia bacterium]
MKQRIVATAVVMAVMATVAALGSSAPAEAVANQTSNDAIGWLVDQQQADGGFELAGFPGFETPDAVLAIAENGQADGSWSLTEARAAVDAVTTGGKSALDYLDDLVEELTADHPGDTPADLAARGAQLAKIIATVVYPLRTTPGISLTDFDPSDDSTDPVNIKATALASEGDGSFSAMSFTGRLYVLLIGAGPAGPAALIDEVRAAQQPNGAWNFNGTPTGTAIDPDTTGLALQALGAAGIRSTDPAVQRGLAALAEAQQPSGGWLSFGAPDPNSTSEAVLGIRASGADPESPCWREAVNPAWAGVPYPKPVTWLRGQQAADGHVEAPSDELAQNTFATSQTVQAVLGFSVWLDNVSAPRPCPTVGSASRYVHALYMDLLGRLADASGTGFLVRRFQAGASRASMVATLTATAEYHRAVVDELYRDYLGRPADRSGLSIWSPWVTVLRTEVQAKLLASGEYFDKAGGTNEDFVDALYHDVLGRPADLGATATFVSWLTSGRSRYDVAKTVLTSPQGYGYVVEQLYRRLLRRGSDPSGRRYWRARLADGMSVETLIASIASSSEYVAKTQSA